MPASLVLGRAIDDVLRSTSLGQQPTPDGATVSRLGEFRGRVLDTVQLGPARGRAVTVDFTATPIRDPDGTHVATLGVNRDVSAIVALEDALRQLAERHPDRIPDPAELGEVALNALLEATAGRAGVVARVEGDHYRVLASRDVPRPILDALIATDLGESRVLQAARACPDPDQSCG